MKKLWIVALCLVLTLSFAACGRNPATSDPVDGSDTPAVSDTPAGNGTTADSDTAVGDGSSTTSGNDAAGTTTTGKDAPAGNNAPTTTTGKNTPAGNNAPTTTTTTGKGNIVDGDLFFGGEDTTTTTTTTTTKKGDTTTTTKKGDTTTTTTTTTKKPTTTTTVAPAEPEEIKNVELPPVGYDIDGKNRIILTDVKVEKKSGNKHVSFTFTNESKKNGKEMIIPEYSEVNYACYDKKGNEIATGKMAIGALEGGDSYTCEVKLPDGTAELKIIGHNLEYWTPWS